MFIAASSKIKKRNYEKEYIRRFSLLYVYTGVGGEPIQRSNTAVWTGTIQVVDQSDRPNYCLNLKKNSCLAVVNGQRKGSQMHFCRKISQKHSQLLKCISHLPTRCASEIGTRIIFLKDLFGPGLSRKAVLLPDDFPSREWGTDLKIPTII